MNQTNLQFKTLLLLLGLVTIAFIWILLPFYGSMFLAVAWASALVNTPLRAVSICLKTGMEAAYREIVMAVSG
jgi:uncharacterized membrane protein (DUF485 family)